MKTQRLPQKASSPDSDIYRAQKFGADVPLSTNLKEYKPKNAAGRDVFSVSMESGTVNTMSPLKAFPLWHREAMQFRR